MKVSRSFIFFYTAFQQLFFFFLQWFLGVLLLLQKVFLLIFVTCKGFQQFFCYSQKFCFLLAKVFNCSFVTCEAFVTFTCFHLVFVLTCYGFKQFFYYIKKLFQWFIFLLAMVFIRTLTKLYADIATFRKVNSICRKKIKQHRSSAVGGT